MATCLGRCSPRTSAEVKCRNAECCEAPLEDFTGTADLWQPGGSQVGRCGSRATGGRLRRPRLRSPRGPCVQTAVSLWAACLARSRVEGGEGRSPGSPHWVWVFTAAESCLSCLTPVLSETLFYHF